MSIILKGIDLPKDEKKPIKIEIWANGDVYKDYGYGYEYKEGIAIQIPKGHGDIVNFRELEEQYWDGNYMEIWKHDLKDIKPILEAEEE